jgi:hypothetical protein
LFQRPLIAMADNCSDKYPSGKGSGSCMSKSECTEAKWNAPVSIITGLCPGGADNICCVWTSEMDASAAAGGSTKEGCVTKDNKTTCTLSNPLGAKGPTGVPQIVSNLIKAALGIIGALTLLMFVWGGFLWMTSAGNQERVKKGSQTMFWAAIGVALVFASYLILNTFTTWLETGNVPGA